MYYIYTRVMLIMPVVTQRLKKGDDLAGILKKSFDIHLGDILVISSKAIATVEGAEIDLRNIQPSTEARKFAEKTSLDPLFVQAILDETKRLNGDIVHITQSVILTSLQPTGMKMGRILCPYAGLDQSNISSGYVIGWPQDPVRSAAVLQKAIGVPIIISDSCSRPGRLGVTAFALAVSGLDPLRSEIGSKDLFGKPLRLTQEAVADQLATAANAVMGNADQSTPGAFIRDSGIPESNFCGWVPGIDPALDMFGST